jgi:prevent-host-death family protein
MTTIKLSTLEAKESFSELINRVSHHKERIILTRRGKEIAAIICIEDLYEIETQKNQQDLHDAVQALKNARTQGTISIDEFKKDIGYTRD